MFGRRIDADIGAKLERALQDRRGKDIVDDELRARLMGQLRHGGDIDRFEQRIGRRFDQDELGRT